MGNSKTIRLRDLVFGPEKPAICVPIMTRTAAEAVRLASRVRRSSADMAELRADALQEEDTRHLKDTVRAVQKALGEKPLLATFRSRAEGGLSDHPYAEACGMLTESCADIIDIEWEHPQMRELLTKAKKAHLPVVVSWHDHTGTPGEETLLTRFRAMAASGADLVKIAVMANSTGDAERLLKAAKAADDALPVPLIVVAMGQAGQISRYDPSSFRSALTFGYLDTPGAPGQVPLEKLRGVL